MTNVLLVGLGGCIGSILRYGLGTWIARLKGGAPFPLETLAVNVFGCLLAGLLAGAAEARGAFSVGARAFLFVGLLGGFTTYSAFGHDTFALLRDGRWSLAAASVVLQVALGLGGVWAGHALVRAAV